MLTADKMLREQFFMAVLTGNAVLAEGKSREKVTADYWDSLFKRQKGKERIANGQAFARGPEREVSHRFPITLESVQKYST